MRPSLYPLTVYCGTTLDAAALSFVYKQGGVVVDLTGFTAAAQGRTRTGGLVFDWTTANSHIVIDGPTGTISFDVSAAESSALTAHTKGVKPTAQSSGLVTYDVGTWALELTSPTGRVVRLVEGPLALSPEIVHE